MRLLADHCDLYRAALIQRLIIGGLVRDQHQASRPGTSAQRTRVKG